MARQKLSRVVREILKDQLVDESLQDRMVAAVARNEKIEGLRWWKDFGPGKASTHQLCTPYGKLEVVRGFGWHVERDSEPLVHARSPEPATFTGLAPAKAAGLIHLRDGFGNDTPYQDGFWWTTSRPATEHLVVESSGDYPVDPSISDDHEWGSQRLGRLLKASVATASTTACIDGNLVSDLQRFARSWQLPQPLWTKRAHGCFELKTPYGILLIRRLVGWTIERNDMPLVWFLSGRRVIFDKLEHAKMSALAHARDYGDIHPFDGTRWAERAELQLAGKYETTDQSGSNGGTLVVDRQVA